MLVFVLTEVDLITVKSPFSCSKVKHVLYTINVRIELNHYYNYYSVHKWMSAFQLILITSLD